MNIAFTPNLTTNFKSGFDFSAIADRKVSDFYITGKLTKTYSFSEGDKRTYVSMYSSKTSDIDDHLPKELKALCLKDMARPSGDLFVVTGINEENKRYVIFSSHFKNPDNGDTCTQIFNVVASDDKMTPTQERIMKSFYRRKNLEQLFKNSSSNPFASVSYGEESLSRNFLRSLAEFEPADMELPEDNVPVIYTADGKYIQYKRFWI